MSIKKTALRIRCDESFKEKVKKYSKERGYDSVSEYIRKTMTKDMDYDGK